MRRRLIAAAAAGLLAATASRAAEEGAAPRPDEPRESAVLRGDIRAVVYANGTVEADDLFRLKSTIEGRVEGLLPSRNTWVRAGTRLGYVVSGELSAIIDAKGGTDQTTLVDRWHPEYAPSMISCPRDCFVTNVFVREKQHVLPNAHLLEAARTLLLVGRVRPEDAARIRTGMTLVAWPTGEPRRKIRAEITSFALDPDDGSDLPRAGTLEARLSPEAYLAPDTAWEGWVEFKVKRDALRVPTRALIQYQGRAYLPILVSTGMTTDVDTEITDGVPENRRILVGGSSLPWSAAPARPAPMPLPARRRPAASSAAGTAAAENGSAAEDETGAAGASARAPADESAAAKRPDAATRAPEAKPRPAARTAAAEKRAAAEAAPRSSENQNVYESEDDASARKRLKSIPQEQMDPDIHDMPPGDDGDE